MHEFMFIFGFNRYCASLAAWQEEGRQHRFGFNLEDVRALALWQANYCGLFIVSFRVIQQTVKCKTFKKSALFPLF